LRFSTLRSAARARARLYALRRVASLAIMLDIGMFMYAGLLVLACWRCLCAYRCCGVWLSFLNYVSLLYLMLAAFAIYSLREFYTIVGGPVDANVRKGFGDVWSIEWLQPMVVAAPIAVCITIVLSWCQAEAHVFEIRKQIGRDKHDRAVQIIALPAVFGVMIMAALVPIVELTTGHADMTMLDAPFNVDVTDIVKSITGARAWRPNVTVGSGQLAMSGLAIETSHKGLQFVDPLATILGGKGVDAADSDKSPEVTEEFENLVKVVLWRYETCFYVADLFEAWALYQFGRLALDLIGETYMRNQPSRELLRSHEAVQALTWLGTITFVLVCLAQTACSLLPYMGGSGEKLDLVMMSFQVAGFFASGAAIYNVYVVERAFHDQLLKCSPVLKFLSVKILVSLAFFQRGTLVLLQSLNTLLPEMVQKLVRYVPLVGDIVNMSSVQMHLFYPALILFECLFAALMHIWAWRASEDWYNEDSPEERQPLVNSDSGSESAWKKDWYNAYSPEERQSLGNSDSGSESGWKKTSSEIQTSSV